MSNYDDNWNINITIQAVVDSIVHYLRESTLSSSVVNSTTTNFDFNNNKFKSSKEKKLTNPMNIKPTPAVTLQPQLAGDIQILPKGRVRYGPVTVNPRKQPSKTLYTGRRSKYEVLSGDEEEKRRDRRERNRVAATKCREKRENVLNRLEKEHTKELHIQERLSKMVEALEQKKNDLETFITNHFNECSLINNLPSSTQSSMIFGDTAFLSSIIDTPPPPPLPSIQEPILHHDDEELSHILDPEPILTNSAYNTDDSNSLLIPQQELQTITMTSGSLEQLINNLQSPTISMENSNNHSILFNSASGSSCAKQHSNSSEDDSLPPTRTNPCVY
ncbi:unnamed protein product [Rotaria sordida]|uniref:BZIP domain-containing protein n=1 Tax=Rotaria sordida TaxID=392033 RepID=A0A815ASB9_9BILA|nr:unnamed protein product [Rotaria sordida]